ncbi:hypothetical protein ACFVH6_09565 [Spirillospora sp. NPDC127200]
MVQRQMGYAVAVPRSQSIGIGPHGNLRAEAVAADVPQDTWHRRSAGDGAKGQRFYDGCGSSRRAERAGALSARSPWTGVSSTVFAT